jgi:hypothetical protein
MRLIVMCSMVVALSGRHRGRSDTHRVRGRLGKTVNSGSTARCFAQYMTIHALGAKGGLYYSQMPRYATANGQGTNEEGKVLKGGNGTPVNNPAREVWIQETALSTGLNTSYMATQVSCSSQNLALIRLQCMTEPSRRPL